MQTTHIGKAVYINMRHILLPILCVIMWKGYAQNLPASNQIWHNSLSVGMVLVPSNSQPLASELTSCFGSYTSVHFTKSFMHFSTRSLNDSVPYHYFGDSLALYPLSRHLYFSLFNCYELTNYEETQLKPEWMFYSTQHVKQKDLSFKLLQLTRWKGGFLEIDGAGNVFFEGKDKFGPYGHFRGSLTTSELNLLKNILSKTYIQLWQMPCCQYRLPSNQSKLRALSLRIGDNSISIKLLEGDARGILGFIDTVVKPEELTFQLFADGDSTQGIYAYQVPAFNIHLMKSHLTYLGTYRDEGEEQHFYKASDNVLLHSLDSAAQSQVTYYPVFLISGKLLDTVNDVALETMPVSDEWFKRGRAFEKPENFLFRKVEACSSIPKGYSILLQFPQDEVFVYRQPRRSHLEEHVTSDPDSPKKYKTKWGAPYPFLTPGFQLAFEKYVLPEWEAFQKKN
jgi:hypothetical protein